MRVDLSNICETEEERDSANLAEVGSNTKGPH